MTLEVRQFQDDKRDYYNEAIKHLNANFKGGDDMEQRIWVYLADYTTKVGARVEEKAPGEFVIYGRGL